VSFLSLDLGTTVCKAALFNLKGELLGLVREEYPVISPHPDWAEQDAETVWRKVQEVVTRIAKENPAKEPIESICISAQGEAVAFLDRKGHPLRNCILGMDMRSTQQVERLKEKFDEKNLYNISGVPPHPITTLAKILWVKDNEPDIFRRAAQFLCYEDFIFLRLAGIAAIDYSLASRTMMFDIDEKKWCSRILEYAGIRKEQLAQVYPSGTVVGRINPCVAQKLGFLKDVSLITGGHDVTCAALGSGAIEEGVGADILGTAEIFGLAVKDREETKKIEPPNFACYTHVLPGRHFLMTLNQTGGLLLNWFRDNFKEKEIEIAEKEGKDVFELLVKKAKEKPANSLILPHFVGSGTPWIDPLSKGAILGLALHTDKSDVIRAVLESVCFEQKISLDIFEQYGFTIREIRAVGGEAKSAKWLKIRADILGKSIKTLKVPEASCLGAAILSGYALGHYPSIDEAAREMVTVKSEIEPDEDLHKRYLRKYHIFKKIYPALKEINYELSEISSL
jgi:xylulokinase